MPEISFSVWCGICGVGACSDTDVSGSNVRYNSVGRAV